MLPLGLLLAILVRASSWLSLPLNFPSYNRHVGLMPIKYELTDPFCLSRPLDLSRHLVPYTMGPGSVGGRSELWGHALAQFLPLLWHSNPPCVGCLGGRGLRIVSVYCITCGFAGLFNKPRWRGAAYLTSAPSLWPLLTNSITRAPTSYLLLHLSAPSFGAPPRTFVGTINTFVGVLQSNPPNTSYCA